MKVILKEVGLNIKGTYFSEEALKKIADISKDKTYVSEFNPSFSNANIKRMISINLSNSAGIISDIKIEDSKLVADFKPNTLVESLIDNDIQYSFGMRSMGTIKKENNNNIIDFNNNFKLVTFDFLEGKQ